MHVIKVYKGINERKEIMKQIIENLMKYTRHAELVSASQFVILSGAKNLNLPLTLALSLKGRGKSVSSAKPTAKSIKVVPTSTGRATCVAHDKNLSTCRLNVLETDNTPHPNPVLDLLHAHRVSPKLLRNKRLNLFAIRTCFTPSVRKSALPQGAREQKCAFTLAEVLITLGIIGVVAAITIPVLVQKYQKLTTVTALKKGYTLVNTAVKLANNEYGENFSNGNAIEMLAGIRPFLNGKFGVCRKPKQMDSYLNGTGAMSDTFKNHALNDNKPNNSTVLLPNGMCIAYSNGSYLAIDINGTKAPNVYGKDIFNFKFDKTKQMFVEPTGWDQAINSAQGACNLNSEYPGTYCSTLIIKSGWTIPKEYPWK